MSEFKRILSYAVPYRGVIALGFILSLMVSVLSLAIPWTLKNFIDAIIHEKNMAKLNLFAIGIISVSIIRSMFLYGQNYFSSVVEQGITMNFRNVIYQHVQNLSMPFFDNQKTGDIFSRILNDVNALQYLYTSTLTGIIINPFTIIFGILLICYLNLKLAMLVLIIVLPIVLFMHRFGRGIRSIAKIAQLKISDVTQLLQETISQVRVVHSFLRQDYEVRRFKEGTRDVFLSMLKLGKMKSFFFTLIDFLSISAIVLVLWLGGREAINNRLTAGDLIASLVYLSIIFSSFSGLSKAYSSLQVSLSAGNRVLEILHEEAKIGEAVDAIDLRNIKGHIEFRNVSFSYNGTKGSVLKNVSFKAAPGEVVALTGSSGAGKTTLINLLLRFYDPSEGKILVDGVDIKKIKLKSLREHIAVVHQEPLLFNRTIIENIRYGNLDATDEEVVRTAKIANAHNFIINLSKGYETVVGERGMILSGGERQRIAIARAVLKNSKIFVLDEAMSSLDYASEALIHEALARFLEDRLVIVISHRDFSVQTATKVIAVGELSHYLPTETPKMENLYCEV